MHGTPSNASGRRNSRRVDRVPGSEMRWPGKVAVVIGLLGFLGCIVAPTAWASMACCEHSCETCPMLVSKSALAGAPSKWDSHRALLSAAFALPTWTATVIHGRTPAQIPTFLPHEFRRPMRN